MFGNNNNNTFGNPNKNTSSSLSSSPWTNNNNTTSFSTSTTSNSTINTFGSPSFGGTTNTNNAMVFGSSSNVVQQQQPSSFSSSNNNISTTFGPSTSTFGPTAPSSFGTTSTATTFGTTNNIATNNTIVSPFASAPNPVNNSMSLTFGTSKNVVANTNTTTTTTNTPSFSSPSFVPNNNNNNTTTNAFVPNNNISFAPINTAQDVPSSFMNPAAKPFFPSTTDNNHNNSAPFSSPNSNSNNTVGMTTTTNNNNNNNNDDDNNMDDTAGVAPDEELARLKAKLEEKKKRLEEKKLKLIQQQQLLPQPSSTTTPSATTTANFSKQPQTPAVQQQQQQQQRPPKQPQPPKKSSSFKNNSTINTTTESSTNAATTTEISATSVVASSNRVDLGNAVTLIGICKTMCPKVELEERLEENAIPVLEQYSDQIHPKNWSLINTVVKRFRRSAADYKLDIPELVRPPPILEQTLSYLEEYVMERDRQGPDPRYSNNEVPPSLDVYQYVWDRTRMLRKDLILQNYMAGNCSATAVRIHERIARWHVLVEHQYSHIPDYRTYQSQQNIQELGQTLKTLNIYYNDSQNRSTDVTVDPSPNHGCMNPVVMGNPPKEANNEPLNNTPCSTCIVGKDHGTAEAEMRGLYILLTIDNDGGMEVLKYASELCRTKPAIYSHPLVQFALKVYKAKQQYNYTSFFKLLKSAPYLYACLMFKYVPNMRKYAFRIMGKTYGGRRKDTGDSLYDDYPIQQLQYLLAFDSFEETINACHHYNISTSDQTIYWRQQDFREPKDPIKHTVIPLVPQKMTSTIELKTKNLTRLAICRGALSHYPLEDDEEEKERLQKQRLLLEKAKKKQREEEAKRRQEEEERQLAAAKEAKRIAMLEEARRRQQQQEKEEATRKAAAAAEAEARRKAAEAELKAKQIAEAKRRKEEEEARQRAILEEKARREAERIAAEKRRAEEEARIQRLKAEQEAMRKKAEAERIAAEKRREQARIQRLKEELEAKRRAEEIARKKAAVELARKKAAELARKKAQEEEEARKKREEEEAKKTLRLDNIIPFPPTMSTTKKRKRLSTSNNMALTLAEFFFRLSSHSAPIWKYNPILENTNDTNGINVVMIKVGVYIPDDHDQAIRSWIFSRIPFQSIQTVTKNHVEYRTVIVELMNLQDNDCDSILMIQPPSSTTIIYPFMKNVVILNMTNILKDESSNNFNIKIVQVDAIPYDSPSIMDEYLDTCLDSIIPPSIPILGIEQYSVVSVCCKALQRVIGALHLELDNNAHHRHHLLMSLFRSTLKSIQDELCQFITTIEKCPYATWPQPEFANSNHCIENYFEKHQRVRDLPLNWLTQLKDASERICNIFHHSNSALTLLKDILAGAPLSVQAMCRKFFDQRNIYECFSTALQWRRDQPSPNNLILFLPQNNLGIILENAINRIMSQDNDAIFKEKSNIDTILEDIESENKTTMANLPSPKLLLPESNHKKEEEGKGSHPVEELSNHFVSYKKRRAPTFCSNDLKESTEFTKRLEQLLAGTATIIPNDSPIEDLINDLPAPRLIMEPK